MAAKDAANIVAASGLPGLARALQVTVRQAGEVSVSAQRHLQHGTPFELRAPTVGRSKAAVAPQVPQAEAVAHEQARVARIAAMPPSERAWHEQDEQRRQSIYKRNVEKATSSTLC
jgi:hypothetical protein